MSLPDPTARQPTDPPGRLGDLALPELPVRRGPDLFHGVVRGRPFVHNPWGYEALAVLSQRAWALLQDADGRPAGVLAQQLSGGDEAEAGRYLAELPMLLRNGFVQAPGVTPHKPTPGPRTFNLWVHLTNACNLACPYCYIHKDTSHMDGDVTAQLLATVERTAASGQIERLHARFAGGEPMLRFDALRRFYDDASQRCQRYGVTFSAAILTNGTVVPDGAAAWCKANDVSVSVSMDGVGEAQDAMRPVKGGGSSFTRVQSGLDEYLEAGIHPYVLVTLGDTNLEGLPALTEHLLSRDLGFRYSLVRDLEWGKGVLDDRRGAVDQPPEAEVPGFLSGEPLRRVQRVLGQCYDLIERTVEARHTAGRPLRPSFRKTHKFCDLEPWRPIQRACGAGTSYVAVSDKGLVSPCQAALHHPGTQPLGEATLPELAKNQTQFGDFHRSAGNPECRSCRFRASCAGGCPLLLHRREGHTDGRSPYCDVYRAVLPRILRISALELVLEQDARRAARPSTASAIAP